MAPKKKAAPAKKSKKSDGGKTPDLSNLTPDIYNKTPEIMEGLS